MNIKNTGTCGIHMYEGLTTADHCVPSGARLIELKQCENCPTHFVRSLCVHPRVERCGCQKYCANCIARVLMPASNVIDFQQELKSIAPQLSKHAVRYDDSLLPRELRRVQKLLWPSYLVKAFGEQGTLSIAQIADIIGTTKGSRVESQCIRAGIQLQFAGFVNEFKNGRNYRSRSFILAGSTVQ